MSRTRLWTVKLPLWFRTGPPLKALLILRSWYAAHTLISLRLWQQSLKKNNLNYLEINFQCLGDWVGHNGQRYMALLDVQDSSTSLTTTGVLTSNGSDPRPRYRCAVCITFYYFFLVLTRQYLYCYWLSFFYFFFSIIPQKLGLKGGFRRTERNWRGEFSLFLFG